VQRLPTAIDAVEERLAKGTQQHDAKSSQQQPVTVDIRVNIDRTPLDPLEVAALASFPVAKAA